jgi:hypothetical protein
VAAVVIIAGGGQSRSQEPPETTGVEDDDEEDGVWEGCCRPEPEVEFELLLVELDDCVALLLTLLLVAVVWPWNDFAATSEIMPEKANAPAIIQRLIRRIRPRPALRELTVVDCIVRTMIGRPCKKPLNPR